MFAVALALWLLMRFTDTGKAIRAVAKEKLGAELSGIDVAHIYAMTFGLGTACLAIAACLLLPTYYVNPHAGNAFVLIAFTIVVLGGMGSVAGALVGGLIIGVVESLCGLYLGDRSARSASSSSSSWCCCSARPGCSESAREGPRADRRSSSRAGARCRCSHRRTSCSISWSWRC